MDLTVSPRDEAKPLQVALHSNLKICFIHFNYILYFSPTEHSLIIIVVN